MEASASIGFLSLASCNLRRGNPKCWTRERPVHAVAALWRHFNNGNNLTLQHPSFGASRPAPAVVNRYDGQGDRTPLARNLGASSAS